MKRIINYLSAAVAIASVVASCTKETDALQDQKVLQNRTRFAATSAVVESKTTIENGEGNHRIVKWVKDDEIKILWDGGSAAATAEEAGESTTFVATVESADNYYAAYPSGAATALNEGVLTIEVPSSPDGTFASANIAVSKTTGASKSFKFYNATALVKFSVSDASYTKAVFQGAKSEPVAGSVPVTFGESGISLGEAVSPAAQIQVSLSGAGEYYFAVLPATFEEGFAVTLYKDDVPQKPVFIRASKTLTRGQLLSLGAVDGIPEMKDFFVTPAGAGKKSGKSWDNAMGVSELKSLIQQPVDGDGNQIDAEANYKAAILDGATIHMAAGEYDLKGDTKIEFSGHTAQVAITFKGGYPADLAGTSLAGRDTTSYRSAFTGESKDGSILTLGNQTNITFEGITFKNATRATNGGAVWGAAGETGNCTLTFSSCRFIGNSNNDTYTGAGLYLSKASATIDKCYFASNHARNGAAVNLASGEGTVTISDCLFEKNSTANTSGCIQNGSTKTVMVTGCTFDGNEAGSYGGGAFHINASGASTTFSGCTFSNNSAPQGGAVSIQNGEATFTGCTFTNNTATKGSKKDAGDDDNDVQAAQAGGAIILHSPSSVCTLNACSFTNNSAPNGSGGAIAYENAAATLNIKAGTSFTGNNAYNLGGAIFVRGAGKLNISGESASKVTFSSNRTLATGNAHANGGAIWLGASSQTTMSHAVFNGCEAGQENGSTVYYSNGGALCIKAVASFSADNCEFTACRGRNGGVLNVELGNGKTISFTSCNFHDNIGRSGQSKNGTGGNFHGAAARLGGSGTTRFTDCTFTDNFAYHGGGALHINSANTIVCSNCTFTNNDANSAGGGFTMENGTLTISGGSISGGNSISNQGGMIYMIKGTLNLDKTTVSACKSASAKSGGAIYVYTGGTSGGAVAITAAQTTFSNNQCGSYNHDSDQGGAIRAEGVSGKVISLSLTDCLFSGNKAKRFGTAVSLNQYCFLKANRCVFSANSGASRGTISYGDNSLIFMNACAFYDNTFSDATTWGLTVHGGGANAGICLNNITAYNNRSTNTNPSTTSNVSINGDTPMLLINSTILDNTAYLLRANARTLQFCNNILINSGTAANIVHSQTSTKTSYGHNAMSGSSGADAATDLTGCTLSSLSGGAWSSNTASSPYYGVYSWNGGLSGFTPAAKDDVTGAIAAYTQAVNAVNVPNAGATFKEWLESLSPKAYAADGRGITRGTPWWPGAYQAN